MKKSILSRFLVLFLASALIMGFSAPALAETIKIGGIMDDDVYPWDSAWSAGFQVDGTLWGRDDDMFGLAIGQVGWDEEFPLRAFATTYIEGA